MTLRQRLNQDLKEAQLKREELRVSVLRLLFANLNNRGIDKRAELTEEEVIGAIVSEIKKRQEAILAFRQGDRPILAEKEEKERLILEAYLPPALSESELRGIIKEVIGATSAQTINDLGQVMKELMPRIRKAGRADGHLVNHLVKEMLS